MKKFIIVFMLFIVFSVFAQDITGKWNYTITYEGGGVQNGVIILGKSIITIDNTSHNYSIKDGIFFIDDLGYYYSIKDDILTLIPAFGGSPHIIKMRRVK